MVSELATQFFLKKELEFDSKVTQQCW